MGQVMFLCLSLADSSVQTRLRELGFGYRARFLQQSAKQILDQHGLQWLEGLRRVPYPEARDALRTLPGVGTKVLYRQRVSYRLCGCVKTETGPVPGSR